MNQEVKSTSNKNNNYNNSSNFLVFGRWPQQVSAFTWLRRCRRGRRHPAAEGCTRRRGGPPGECRRWRRARRRSGWRAGSVEVALEESPHPK